MSRFIRKQFARVLTAGALLAPAGTSRGSSGSTPHARNFWCAGPVATSMTAKELHQQKVVREFVLDGETLKIDVEELGLTVVFSKMK